MNTIENTDIYKKLTLIFKDESIEFIKRITNEIIEEMNYDYFINNVDIDEEDDNKIHYNFIDDD